MRAIAFLDGAKGYASQLFENKKHGVRAVKERTERGLPFVQTWTCNKLPGRLFKTYAELRAAFDEVLNAP